MSEAAAEEVPEWRKKRRVKESTKRALLATIDAARFVTKPNLAAIAARHGVKYGTLKQTYYRWQHGLIELGDPPTPIEQEIDVKSEMRRSLDLVKDGEQFLNDMFEGTMAQVKMKTMEGQTKAFFEMGMPQIISSMLSLCRLRNEKEKGFMAVLEAVQKAEQAERRRREEDGRTIDVTPGRVEAATFAQKFEQLARAADTAAEAK